MRDFAGRRRTLRPVLFLAAFLALVAVGCSGLDPQRPDEPPDPNSPCNVLPQVVAAFPNGYGPVGTDTTLDMATWNIQTFAKSGSITISKVAEIIRTLNLDVIAVEEISDTTDFNALMGLLPEYGSLLSPEEYRDNCNPDFDLCYQKTGIVYRKSVVSVQGVTIPSAFSSQSYNFAGRIPMDIALSAQSNGKTYDFHLIVVHLKAGASNEEDAVRRRASSTAIHNYIDDQTLQNPSINYVVAGDWNDFLTDPISYNSFPSFLNDAGDYKFLTSALVGRSDMNSHPLGLIDHILVNRGACPEFSSGRITTLRLDQVIDGYTTYVSDHRPVMVSIPVFK
jgi:endonuclease/exonuclease/phosphatase family metal-dependent hydrolase